MQHQRQALQDLEIEAAMNCEKCGELMRGMAGYGETLVAFSSNCPQSNHDDNCRLKLYLCPNGHARRLSIRRTCPCGWKGIQTCFCHEGEKVDAWPEPFEP